MELGQYVDALRKRWLLIATMAVVGVLAGYGAAAVATPTYRASSAVFVSLERGDTVSELVQGSTYTQNLVQSYAQLATLPVVLDPVIQDLELDTSARTLATRVSAQAPVNTVIIDISAQSDSAETATRIADAVAAQLAVAVADVSPKDEAGNATVSVQTVAPAQVPRFAISPNTKLNMASGLLAGLALGVGLALGRAVLNTRVRTVDDVARVTSQAVLSTVPRTKGSSGEQVVMLTQPLSSRAESYRRLRANLQFFGVSDRLTSVVVTSALPGEGKSTTAINLALALAEGPSTVLLIDADLRRPSVAEYTGIEGSVGLTTVLIGDAALEDVVQPWGAERLSVLPSGSLPPNPSQLLDSREMASLLERVTQEYDIVVIDSAPLLPVSDAAVLSRLTDGAVVVAAHRDLHRNQLSAALESLEAVGATCLGIVLNRSTGTTDQTTYGYAPQPDRRPTTVGRLLRRDSRTLGTVERPRATDRSPVTTRPADQGAPAAARMDGTADILPPGSDRARTSGAARTPATRPVESRAQFRPGAPQGSARR